MPISSWETGYGDMVMTPDFDTLRLIPWLPGTALVMADLSWTDGTPGAAGAAQHPAHPARTASPSAAWRAFVGTELEFIVFDDTYRDAWKAGYRGLTPATRLQRRLRDARIDPDGTAAARHPQRHGWRGHVLRGRQG